MPTRVYSGFMMLARCPSLFIVKLALLQGADAVKSLRVRGRRVGGFSLGVEKLHLGARHHSHRRPVLFLSRHPTANPAIHGVEEVGDEGQQQQDGEPPFAMASGVFELDRVHGKAPFEV